MNGEHSSNVDSDARRVDVTKVVDDEMMRARWVQLGKGIVESIACVIQITDLEVS